MARTGRSTGGATGSTSGSGGTTSGGSTAGAGTTGGTTGTGVTPEGPAQDSAPLPANTTGETANMEATPSAGKSNADPDVDTGGSALPEVEVDEDEDGEKASGTVVFYPGDQVTRAREMSVADWKSMGVESDEPRPIRWGPENSWQVPIEDLDFLTAEERQAFIENNGFKVYQR